MRSRRTVVAGAFVLVVAAGAIVAVLSRSTGLAENPAPPIEPVLPADPTDVMGQLCAQLDADHEAAYNALRAGGVWEGAAVLVDSLRLIPSDDPYFITDQLMDSAIASCRLAVFVMAELMDEELRTDFSTT